MSHPSADLVAKMEALLRKHPPDALIDRGLDDDDFPLLEDVVAAHDEQHGAPGGVERRQADRRQADRRTQQRRLGERRQVDARLAEPSMTAPPDLERLFEALERRLADLFIRQQLRTEDAVRKIVREELARAADS